MADRTRALGDAVWRALQQMVRDLLARKAGGHLIEANLPDLDLRLPLVTEGPEAGSQSFTCELRRCIERQLDEAIERAAAFRPGHAFCHRCGAATCEHSLPPSSRHVFVGYAPTGLPRWEEFAQYCLQQHHPDVDRLYDSPPAFLTTVQDAGTLRADLLTPFQIDSHELLGQLAAGFFPVPARAGEGRGVLALTFQVTLARMSNGKQRLGLNLLGRTPRGEDLEMLWEGQQDLPWRRAVRWAQATLESVSRQLSKKRRWRRRASATSPRELESRVDGILNGLARRLEQDLRARSRRTAHANARHAEGDRPTRKALQDIREARTVESFLVDERSGALVILGERGRTHFFTPEGRLVSSVRYSREAIERKRKAGLWRGATENEAQEFRLRLLEDRRERREDGAGTP